MKLKKLILSGFKSFADKTEFDFDEGVSCVVGPNGCGKSNIVDAIKWVLGEQSAKSLRGGEMLDVIFNGSATRRAGGVAEVILVFDNTSGVLDAAAGPGEASPNEVAIGRRLFRSGVSEYLINNTPCRLRDIRDLFMGTGIGHDAYALIEQGRVEAFLQGSSDDRRAIFDEAAGISKYKARKKEALRKLDRVEQNLLRLDDIVGEVEKRLRSIKYQAGKARNYQEYSQRLKELRSLHFLAQYHTMIDKRTALQQRLDDQSASLTMITRRIEQLETAGSGAEFEAAEMERTATELNSRAATTTAQLTACRERETMLAEKIRELRDQITADAQRCEQLEAKAEDCARQQQGHQTRVDEVEIELTEMTARAQAAAEAFQQGELALTHLTASLEDEKAGTIDLLRRTAQLHNDISASAIRRENLHSRQTALKDRAQKITDDLTSLLSGRSEAQAKLRDVQEVLADAQGRLDETRRTGTQLSHDEDRLQESLSAAREERSGVAARIDALREMLSRLEGVGAGVKRVIEAHRAGQLPAVRGMLGEFIETDVQHARLVEAALAGVEQTLVVERFEQLQAAGDSIGELLAEGGSVEMLCLDRLEAWHCDFPGESMPENVTRVIDWVTFDEFIAPAMWRLLGRTLVVRSLAEAAETARKLPGRWRFVTEAGEVLEPDGRVRVGSAKAAGVISRRSEQAGLEATLAELAVRIDALQLQWQQTHEKRQHADELVTQLRTAIYAANTERVEAEGRLAQFVDQVDHLQREEPVVAGDIATLAAEIDQAVAAEHDAKRQAAELEHLSAERNAQIESIAQQIDQARKDQEIRSAGMTELKVEQGRLQQQKLSLTDAAAALARQAEQIAQDLTATRNQARLSASRVTDTEQAVATAQAEAQRLSAEQESVAREVAQIAESRKSLADRIQEIRRELAQQRQDHDEANEIVGSVRVEIAQADAHVDDLITRAADEMNMDLRQLRESYEHDEQRDWSAVETEINDLKGKVERLGNVNLDAIEEQVELEERREFLDSQLSDVRNSQKQIEELIDRLNTESHQRFVETFEAVRVNFQDLFRKLFGGGKADILLTMPEDVLESGIEIVARPPGKELRSITLLSGGEKTMTALALMMSMFKHRPTPFCLLDEVDAALDEANTKRFAMLVQEFIAHSQFIIISHAKRTMSMANVLYGVTMQTPGVSTRISVKFEDVGHALDAKLQPAAAE